MKRIDILIYLLCLSIILFCASWYYLDANLSYHDYVLKNYYCGVPSSSSQHENCQILNQDINNMEKNTVLIGIFALSGIGILMFLFLVFVIYRKELPRYSDVTLK